LKPGGETEMASTIEATAIDETTAAGKLQMQLRWRTSTWPLPLMVHEQSCLRMFAALMFADIGKTTADTTNGTRMRF
jgi:hypothetical protein